MLLRNSGLFVIKAITTCVKEIHDQVEVVRALREVDNFNLLD